MLCLSRRLIISAFTRTCPQPRRPTSPTSPTRNPTRQPHRPRNSSPSLPSTSDGSSSWTMRICPCSSPSSRFAPSPPSLAPSPTLPQTRTDLPSIYLSSRGIQTAVPPLAPPPQHPHPPFPPHSERPPLPPTTRTPTEPASEVASVGRAGRCLEQGPWEVARVRRRMRSGLR